jgi:hypothetical protein
MHRLAARSLSGVPTYEDETVAEVINRALQTLGAAFSVGGAHRLEHPEELSEEYAFPGSRDRHLPSKVIQTLAIHARLRVVNRHS